jgi:hypothetical protein
MTQGIVMRGDGNEKETGPQLIKTLRCPLNFRLSSVKLRLPSSISFVLDSEQLVFDAEASVDRKVPSGV